MSQSFFDRPILNSPYDYPARYWELDENGQPTNRVIERRRIRVLKPNDPDSCYQSREPVPSDLLRDLGRKSTPKDLGLTDEAQQP